jgi:hydroxyacylglutathione hydrolase
MQLRLGEHTFEVRHTPGHTPGHVSFLLREAGIQFCGDLIFMGSVGRTDFPGGDMQVLLNSIRQEVLSLPDDVRLLSGHGPETTVGRERRSNPFLTGLG